MALTAIGPVTVSHGDPSFVANSAPTTHGIDDVTIAGSCSWTAEKQLREMVRNPDNRTTVGGRTGVLEWLAFDDTLLDDWTGYYLLETFNVTAGHTASLASTDVPFTLTAAYLGDLA